MKKRSKANHTSKRQHDVMGIHSQDYTSPKAKNARTEGPPQSPPPSELSKTSLPVGKKTDTGSTVNINKYVEGGLLVILVIILAVYVTKNWTSLVPAGNNSSTALQVNKLPQQGSGSIGGKPSQAPTPTPTPTPIQLHPDNGTQGTYMVSQGQNHVGPNITKVIFDPLNAQKGQSLVIWAHTENTSPVTAVTGSLQTDHGTVPLTFTMTGGTTVAGDWQAKISLTDTVWYTYILTVHATGQNGTSTVTVAPRS